MKSFLLILGLLFASTSAGQPRANGILMEASWNAHIINICNNIRSFAFALWPRTKIINIKIALQTYLGYVCSILRYKIIEEQALIAQNACMRAICNFDIMTSCRPFIEHMKYFYSTPARIIEGIVAQAIEDLSQRIRDDGLDPFHFTDAVHHSLPVTELMVLKAQVEDLVMVGLSKIIVNGVSYSLITGRVTFDISVPNISVSVASSSAAISFFGFKSDAKVTGSLNVMNTRVTGEGRVTAGIITGISLREIDVDFRVEAIQPDLKVSIGDVDYTKTANDMLRYTIPKALEDSRNDINTVLEYYITQAFEEFLG